MMMMPSLFDDWMMDPFERSFFVKRRPEPAKRPQMPTMKTDIRELESAYALDIDLPGFKKEDLQVQLEKGYLTIGATKSTETKEGEGKYIRRERYQGQCARRFYVGEALQPEDIHAKFEDGILTVTVPKAEAKAIEQKKLIAIEG